MKATKESSRNGHRQPQEAEIPPSDVDAERAVLGAVLLAPYVLDDVIVLLRSEDFYTAHHQVIYSAIVDLHSNGKQLDSTLLLTKLRKTTPKDKDKTAGECELAYFGGLPYLAALVTEAPIASHAVHYAQVVREKSVMRMLIHAASDIAAAARDPEKDSDEQLSFAESRIMAIRDTRTIESIISNSDAMSSTLGEIEKRLCGESATEGMTTGLTDLDAKLHHLRPGNLVIVAARPSMGKTALALRIAEHAVAEQKPCYFVSLEMSHLELAERMLSSKSRVPLSRMLAGTMTREEQRVIVEASAELGAGKLFIDDSSKRTVSEIAAVARRLKRKHGLSLIVIDYIQLIEPENTRDQREQQVARISRRLKAMAKELEVPVVCLAQLNRQNESRPDKQPRLSDLRESGSIEQDADVVLFVHRPEYYMTRENAIAANVNGIAELLIAKQRNGPTGVVKTAWFAEVVRFDNLAFGGTAEEWTPEF